MITSQTQRRQLAVFIAFAVSYVFAATHLWLFYLEDTEVGEFSLKCSQLHFDRYLGPLSLLECAHRGTDLTFFVGLSAFVLFCAGMSLLSRQRIVRAIFAVNILCVWLAFYVLRSISLGMLG